MPEGADEADVRRLTTGVVYEDAWMRLRRDEIERRDGSRGTYAYVDNIGFLHSAHGISSQGGHYFVATELEPGPPEREREEQDMRQAWVHRARFEEMIGEGLITDDSTLAAYALLLIGERRGKGKEWPGR
jgi:8-oxo-dGDP phosphatase